MASRKRGREAAFEPVEAAECIAQSLGHLDADSEVVLVQLPASVDLAKLHGTVVGDAASGDLHLELEASGAVPDISALLPKADGKLLPAAKPTRCARVLAGIKPATSAIPLGKRQPLPPSDARLRYKLLPSGAERNAAQDNATTAKPAKRAKH